MPCTNEYPERTSRQAENQAVAEHLLYAREGFGCAPAPRDVRVTAQTYYAQLDFTEDLCTLLRNTLAEMPELFDAVVYARNNEARALASWWERHQKLDAQRAAQEAREQARLKVVAAAREKLTPEERRALGID